MTSEVGDNNFSNTIATLLKEGNTLNALTLFTDNKNSEEVHNNCWDLIPVVVRYLTAEHEYSNVEVFKCCQKLLDVIVEHSKPEEVLLQFIEEIETAEDDTKFLMLLKPCEKVLLRIPDKRITSLAWCFNAIKGYLEKLETPDDFNLTSEERLLLDSNEAVNRIVYLYNELMSFCETFLHELVHLQSKNITERKQVLGKFLVELIGKPLAYLDMDMYKNTKPKARAIAEELVGKFFSIKSDPFLFLELHHDCDNSDLIKPNDLALGVFYYLILFEGICTQFIPKIYNPIYILNNTLKLVNKLLVQENQFVVEKGVYLASASLKDIARLQLPYLLLDLEDHSKFCKNLSNIIVHNESRNVRKKGLEILQRYIWAFEHQGRYLVIINLIRVLGHSGLKGNIITQYKEMLIEEMSINEWKQVSKYYCGRKLFDLLDQFTYLKQKEETDLVDESDQIVSTLNLLRYLIIADNDGCTQIDHYLSILEDGYFKYLETGIDISKEHYRLKIQEVSEENDKKDSDCKISVTVSGQNLMEMPTERKIEIMNLSLTTLDVIHSLLSRVLECLKLRKSHV